MNLNTMQEIIKRKPTFFIVTSFVYLLLVAVLKWTIHPSVDTILYIVGGVLGIFFLDIAEVFFNLNPSPFRSIVFFCAFIGVSFFIVTSSGSALASGLVLSLYLTLLLWLLGQWKIEGNIHSWFTMIATPITTKTEGWVLSISGIFFLLLTFLFVR